MITTILAIFLVAMSGITITLFTLQSRRISFLYSLIETMLASNLALTNHAVRVRDLLNESKENEHDQEEPSHH